MISLALRENREVLKRNKEKQDIWQRKNLDMFTY